MMVNRNPENYLKRYKEKFSQENYVALKEFVDSVEFSLAERTIYDYLTTINSMLKRFAPKGFNLSEPTEKQIKTIAKGIKNSDLAGDTKRTHFKVLKTFYREYKEGEFYELTNCFTVSGSSRKVENQMILTPKEVRDIINSTTNIRDKAFFRLLYECACTPGELLQAQLQDVDLEEETIYIRGNKNHRDQAMELHNEGVAHLREYLRYHPKVEDIFSTNSEDPLWIVLKNSEGKSKEVKKVGYRSIYKSFQRALKQSSLKRNVKMKYLRKSMITRLCEEGAGYEQLNSFARWVPGSNQAGHYVSISNNKTRELIKEKFKGEKNTGKDIIECYNCGARNPASEIECKRCHRPLNAPKSEKMRKASEMADRLASFNEERLNKIENNLEVLESPEDMIDRKIEAKLNEKG